MSNFRWLLAVLLAVAAIPVGVDAQQTGTITGQVLDAATGRPLGSVTVQVTGSQARAATDAEGRYTIRGVPAGSRTATASLVGRTGQTLPVTVVAGQTATVNFRLAETATELEGIVVSAITGRQERKRESGANVSTITVADIPQGPITKFSDVLTGRTTGVNLQGVAGQTGTSQRIRIRGANSLSLSNEPLIYVDGVLFSNSKGGIGVGGQDFSRLNDLNSEDIASVEVLKGPAASALYGTAAANGVLLITTRRGRVGAATWRAYAEGGVLEDVTDYPANFLTVQRNTTDPNAQLFFTEGANAGRLNTPAFTPCNNLDAATRNAAGQPLCRQDETFSFNPLRDPGLSPLSRGDRSKFGLSASGGVEGVTYFLSADKEDEQGVISFNTLDKTNLRANLNANLRENLRVQLNSGYIRSNVAINSGDNSVFSPLINGLLGLPYRLPEGTDTLFRASRRPSFGFGYTAADIGEFITNQEVDRFLLGLNTTYQPATWLSTNVNVGLDYFNRHDFQTLQPGRLPIGGSFTLGRRQSNRANSYSYTANGSAVGTFDLRENLVSTSTLGGAFTRELFEGTFCFGAGIVEGTRSCGAASSLFSIDESFSEVRTVGGFFQQQFALNDRLFLAGSVRGDNNSAFGTDFGFIYYPSASVSWVVTEEPFFPEQLDFLSNLRLRAAVGTSGLRPNFRDAVTLLDPVSVRAEGSDQSGIRLRSIGNPNLKPERTREYEFGGDLGLLNDRVSAEFTYFTKRSQDALISAPLAPSFGLTGELGTTGSIFTNLGAIRNSGTELALNARVLDQDRTRLNLRLSATTIQNSIEELGAGIQPIVFNRGQQRHQEGFPAGAFFQLPYKFEDRNGDGKLSRDEVTIDRDRFTVVQRTLLNGDRITDTIPQVFLGSSLPTNTQSITADLTLFKYVTLNTLFERRAGMKQSNQSESFRCGTGFTRTGRTATRPLPQGGCEALQDPNASLDEQARFIANRFLGTGAGYIEDADFIKWREASITLGAPPALSRGFRALEGASLTLSGRNLRTWTDYTGLDPEINESGGSANFSQNEFNTQPPVRYFTARLDFTF